MGWCWRDGCMGVEGRAGWRRQVVGVAGMVCGASGPGERGQQERPDEGVCAQACVAKSTAQQKKSINAPPSIPP
jgi:hypothetical protein